MHEVYVSVDIEADGPIPGPHSMLSIGAAAFLPNGAMISTFSVNLLQMKGAAPMPATMEWWRERPAAWAQTRIDAIAPSDAMRNFAAWVKSLPGMPIFIGYPAAYDFVFVYWYLMYFVGISPFGKSALDIKTFAMALLGLPYRDVTLRTMPARWALPNAGPSHNALEDAIEQGRLFCSMLQQQAS